MSNNNNRKPYIVVFGPQNVGKSTLVGYLFTKDWTEERFLAEEAKIKSRIGSHYDPKSRLALFVDTAKDEYRRTYLDGSSKHLHVKEVGDFTVIDTPGAATQRKERYKGIFLGEVGLFLIELEKILDLLRLNVTGKIESDIDYSPIFNDFFGALYVWQKLKPSSKMFIGLTKIDYQQYTVKDVERAMSFLHSEIVNRDEVPIIPMSIDVRNRTDVGITGRSIYYDKSLLDVLSELVNVTHHKQETHLFMVNDKRYGNVPGYGEIFRWKVISGTVHVNDRIQITPVRYNDTITSVTVTVRSLNNFLREEMQEACDGDVVSLVMSNVKNVKNRSIKKEEIQLMRTSIAIRVDDRAVFGDEISVDVDLSDSSFMEKKKIRNLKQHSLVYVAWFGRMISTEVLDCQLVSEQLIALTLLHKGSRNLFSLPKVDNRLIKDKCIIQLRQDQTVGVDHATFISYKATVRDIKISTNMPLVKKDPPMEDGT